jgi:hypothetical protein
LLGKAQKVIYDYLYSDRAVFNLFGQLDVGISQRQVNYGAIGLSLLNMRNQLAEPDTIVGFPHSMCCGLAGGDWDIILEMIEFYFKDYSVRIYKL